MAQFGIKLYSCKIYCISSLPLKGLIQYQPRKSGEFEFRTFKGSVGKLGLNSKSKVRYISHYLKIPKGSDQKQRRKCGDNRWSQFNKVPQSIFLTVEKNAKNSTFFSTPEIIMLVCCCFWGFFVCFFLLLFFWLLLFYIDS